MSHEAVAEALRKKTEFDKKKVDDAVAENTAIDDLLTKSAAALSLRSSIIAKKNTPSKGAKRS